MSFNYLGRNIHHSMVPLMGNMPNGTNYLQSHLAAAAAAAAGQFPPHLNHGIPPHLQAAALNDSPLEFNNKTSNPTTSSIITQATTTANTSLNSTAESSLQHLQQQQQQQKSDTQSNNSTINNNNNLNNSAQQNRGAGPMDLENEHERLSNATSCIAAEINKRLAKREHKSNLNIDDDSSLVNDSIGSGNPNNILGGNGGLTQTKLLMTNDIFLNGMMGVGPPPPPPQSGPQHHQGFMMMPGMMMDPAMAATLQMQQFSQHQLLPPQLAQLANQQALVPQQSSSQLNVNSGQNSNEQQSNQPIKEIITCKSCILYPPNPNAPPPTIRERPAGCRTVFVGGLPDRVTEEIIREIFESCGEITTLRLSKKNFCHIRFVFEASVDSAIYLSGYRLRINNSNEPSHCGRMHVDYAQARDDQYEWECKQRQLQREQRHKERMERDRLRSLSPPPIVHYSEHEASNTTEKLKNDETFTKAVQTLIAWLERGDCSKKNANSFYTMIQSTNAHVRRLQNDRTEHEEALKKARELYRKQILQMAQQFTQIEKVFNAASHKKVWDHFTKAQRKNIDQWKKSSTDMRTIHIEDDEMDMSDDDRDCRSTSSKRTRYDHDLKDENDSLRCQLEAYKNEMNLVKSDQKTDSDIREKQIKVLQETIRNLQTQLLDNKAKEKEVTSKVVDLEDKLKQANVKELLLKTKIANNRISSKTLENLDEDDKDKLEIINDNGNIQNILNNNNIQVKFDGQSQQHQNQQLNQKIDLDEARIIGLVSTFLVVHPFGASPDYICSYLQKMHPNLRPRDLEEILSKYHTIFHEEITGIGMKIERKWKFCGFEQP